MIVEADHERGNDIELLTKLRERTERLNLLNDATNTKQACDFTEHRQAIQVEADPRMSKKLGDIKKISCATPQIENLFGPREVELKLANPPDVHSNPAIKIEIFWPVRPRICYGVSLANVLEPSWIDRFNNALCLQREPVRAQHPEGVFSRAGKTPPVDQFSYFMAKLHSSHLVAKQDNFN